MDRAVAPGSRVAADPLGNGLPRIAPAASVLVPESPLPRLSTLRARALPIMVNNAPGAWICRSAGRSHAIPREGQICRRVSRWAVPSCYKGFAAVPRREIAAATILSYALHGRRQSLRTPRALHRELQKPREQEDRKILQRLRSPRPHSLRNPDKHRSNRGRDSDT